MNQTSSHKLIIVLIAAITVALAALGITAGIYYAKTHPKDAVVNTISLETTVVTQAATTATEPAETEPETTITSATEPVPEATESATAETTAAEEVSEEPQEEAPAEEELSAEPAQDLPYISSARIVGEYNDFGAGYMYRLDLQGNFAYWIAEVTETEFAPGDPYVHTVSSRDLIPNSPYITGGSSIHDLRATVTPYDANDVPGTPYSVKWNERDIEFHPSLCTYLFTGYVDLETATLNLRSHPSTDSVVFAQIPAKSELDIYSSSLTGWYIVNYNGIWGYVSAEYIGWT